MKVARPVLTSGGRRALRLLPESIGNLKSLEYLHVNKNQLTSLPESIGNLTSLQMLYIDNNQLESLPETSKKWLKQLEKAGCRIYTNNW